jgi:hypothetical protein
MFLVEPAQTPETTGFRPASFHGFGAPNIRLKATLLPPIIGLDLQSSGPSFHR